MRISMALLLNEGGYKLKLTYDWHFWQQIRGEVPVVIDQQTKV